MHQNDMHQSSSRGVLHLCCYNDGRPIGLLLKPRADDLLRATGRFCLHGDWVQLCSVQEVDACVSRVIHYGVTLCLAVLLPKRHCAETDLR